MGFAGSLLLWQAWLTYGVVKVHCMLLWQAWLTYGGVKVHCMLLWAMQWRILQEITLTLANRSS